MGRLTKEKIVQLEKINRERNYISQCLEKGIITDRNLFRLIIKSPNRIFRNKTTPYTNKQKLLFSIYYSPFLLCDQKYLSDNMKRMLPVFLEYRYNQELEELQYRFEDAQISQEEYDKEVDLINFSYYKSSEDGKKIEKTGKAKYIKSNTLTFRRC